MSKDGTYRGGRRVRAGNKPDSLADKIASGRSARIFEPVDLEDETLFKVDDNDFLSYENLEGEKIPKPILRLSQDMSNVKRP